MKSPHHPRTAPPTAPFVDDGMPVGRARALPWVTVMLGSLATIVPVVANVGLFPPVGLLILLAWRLLAPMALRMWAPALLGLFDDLVSGQPLGSAMLLWQMVFFGIAIVDRQTMFRDFVEDWGIAAGGIALCLIGGRIVAVPVGAHVDGVLMVQIAVAILLFPAAARTVAWIDRKRGMAA